MIQCTNAPHDLNGIQVLSEAFSFQCFLVAQPPSSDHVDAIPWVFRVESLHRAAKAVPKQKQRAE